MNARKSIHKIRADLREERSYLGALQVALLDGGASAYSNLTLVVGI
jgi:hypothetical protein